MYISTVRAKISGSQRTLRLTLYGIKILQILGFKKYVSKLVILVLFLFWYYLVIF